jgi:hypothetical protein
MQGEGAHCLSLDIRAVKSSEIHEIVTKDGIFAFDKLPRLKAVSLQMGLSEPSGQVLSYVFVKWTL